jgi:hypothetical protein
MPRRVRIRIIDTESDSTPWIRPPVSCIIPDCERSDNVGLDGNMKCDNHKSHHCTYGTCRRKINGMKACSSHRCTVSNTCFRAFVYETNGIKYCLRHNICSVNGCHILRMSNVDYCYEHTARGCPSSGCPSIRDVDKPYCNNHICIYNQRDPNIIPEGYETGFPKCIREGKLVYVESTNLIICEHHQNKINNPRSRENRDHMIKELIEWGFPSYVRTLPNLSTRLSNLAQQYMFSAVFTNIIRSNVTLISSRNRVFIPITPEDPEGINAAITASLTAQPERPAPVVEQAIKSFEFDNQVECSICLIKFLEDEFVESKDIKFKIYVCKKNNIHILHLECYSNLISNNFHPNKQCNLCT